MNSGTMTLQKMRIIAVPLQKQQRIKPSTQPSFLHFSFFPPANTTTCINYVLAQSQLLSAFQDQSQHEGNAASFGQAPWPLVRNLPDFIKNKPVFQLIHGFVNEMKTKISCTQLGNVHIIPVTSPEISREFLKTHDAVFASRLNTIVSEFSSRGFLSIYSSGAKGRAVEEGEKDCCF